jgi:hypothetical protein
MHADGPEAKFAPFSLIPRIAVIGLLAASAGFKAEELASGATGSFPWKQGALVSWELVLALWLASGVLWQAATRTAMGTFGLFASVSLAMAANGRSTCGCMGQVQVSPWLMFTVDASLVVLLACSPGEPPKLTRGTLAALAAAVVAGLSVVFVHAPGGQKAMLQDLLPAELRQGTWEVTVVRASCPACDAHLEQVRRDGDDAPRRRALLVLGREEPWLRAHHRSFDAHFAAYPPDSLKIPTPTRLLVLDGVVSQLRSPPPTGDQAAGQ